MDDHTTTGRPKTGGGGHEEPNPSPLDSLGGERVTLTRGPETSAKTPLIWGVAATEEFDRAQRKVVKALRKLAAALTTIRGSKTVTEVEVRDALSRIVVGLPQPRWVRVGRIISIMAIFGGGAGLSYGLQNADPVSCGLCVAIVLFSLFLEEVLLKYKKYP